MLLSKILLLGGAGLAILGVTLIVTSRSMAQYKSNGSLIPVMTPKAAAITGWVMIGLAVLAVAVEPLLTP